MMSKTGSIIIHDLILAGICGLLLVAPLGVRAQDTAETEAEYELEEVRVTTSTKTEHAIDDDVPVTVEVITKEELETAKVQTIQEALKYVGGITISTQSGYYGQSPVRINGMQPTHTLVLVDGQRLGEQGGVVLKDYSTEMVEQIEIVKGPLSSLYGSDAMGGVINIITKKKADRPYGNFSITGGSRDTQIYSGSAGFGKDQYGGVVTYTHHQSDGIEHGVDDYEKDVFNASLGYDFNSKSKLEIRPFYSKYYMKYQNEYTKEDSGLNLKWKGAPDQLSNWYVSASVFRYDYDTDGGTTDNVFDYFEGEVGYSRLLTGRHLVTAGAHYHQEELTDYIADYTGDQDINAFFIQDEIDFNQLQIVVGARIDRHNEWGTELSPNLSMCYRLNEKARIRGSVAKAFCAPGLNRLYASWLLGKYYYHANPDLTPEKSIGYQLGVDYRFNERVSGQVNLFRNDVDDLITWSYVYNSTTQLYDVYWENADEGMTQGLELSLRTQLSKTLYVNIGYTLLDTESKTTGKELPFDPKNSFNLGLNWQARPNWQFSLSGLYVGKRYQNSSNTIRIDDYWLLNLGFEKKFNEHYRLVFSANNLLGKEGISDASDLDGVEYYVGIKTNI
jgi:outer membrane receptor for ferrienterochelin and colicins